MVNPNKKPVRGAPVMVDEAYFNGRYSTFAGQTGLGGSTWYELTLTNGWALPAGLNPIENAVLRWGPVCFIRLALDKSSATNSSAATVPDLYVPDEAVVLALLVPEYKQNETLNSYAIIHGVTDPSPGLVEIFQYTATQSDEFYNHASYWVGLI